jgi:hypothetical protein
MLQDYSMILREALAVDQNKNDRRLQAFRH